MKRETSIKQKERYIMNYQEYIDQANERIRLTKQIIEQAEKRNKRYTRLAYLLFVLGIVIMILQFLYNIK